MITDFFKPPSSKSGLGPAQRSASTTTTITTTTASNAPPIAKNQPSRNSLPPSRPTILHPAFPSLSNDTESLSRGRKLIPPPPYPHPLKSAPTPHSRVTVQPIHISHVLSLQQMTRALLPVRYSTSHYSEAITDPRIASVSRAAVYNDEMGFSDLGSRPKAHPADKIVGTIKCVLEPIVSTEVPSASPVANNLYIETLLLQAPYRGNGIAKALLESLLYTPVQSSQCNQASGPFLSEDVSDIVRHYNIRTVSAHVHEGNEDALAWYIARGFVIQPVTIEGYYRKMRPSGAKIVVKALHWVDEQRHSSKPSAADASDDCLSPRKRIRSS